MAKKLRYEEVKNYIESQGYKLLSNEYKNGNDKLHLECPFHHKFYMKFNDFKFSGNRCQQCNLDNRKNTYEKIISLFANSGYKLLSKSYYKNTDKLKTICPYGHVYHVSYSEFKNGSRCTTCNKIKRKNKIYEKIKRMVEENGDVLLSKDYEKWDKSLKIRCSCGNIFYSRPGNYKKGFRCRRCSTKKKGASQRLSIEIIENFISDQGYKLISKEYVNNKTKLQMECPIGHIFHIRYDNFKSGQRCPICNYKSYTSKPEREIQKVVSKIYDGKIKPNNRDTIINPSTGWNLELDIYLPEINKAIEFNGEYWHSFPNKIEKDKIKEEQCRKNNIDLLVIEEENWINNKETCLKVIESFIKENN